MLAKEKLIEIVGADNFTDDLMQRSGLNQPNKYLQSSSLPMNLRFLLSLEEQAQVSAEE